MRLNTSLLCGMLHPTQIVNVALLVATTFLLSSVAEASRLKTIYSFCAKAACEDGASPNSTLARDATGNLFGTTPYGGSEGGLNGGGTVFELLRDKNGKSRFKSLYKFCLQPPQCLDGSQPQTSLIVDTAGNVYGTTVFGGPSGGGTAFALSPGTRGASWTMTILHSFSASGPDGNGPSGPLTYAGAAAGNPYDGVSPLYGVTGNGGINGKGTVYELTQNSGVWSSTTIYSFSGGDDGEYPISGLTLDPSGSLFGVTLHGGGGSGSVFRLTPQDGGWNETILKGFTGGSDSYYPWGTLLLDSTGSLFGTNSWGGPYCRRAHHGYVRCGGSIFELNTDGSQYKVLYYFCAIKRSCEDGGPSNTGVILGHAGELYGTAGGGTHGGGVVFRLRPTGKYQQIYNFCSADNCTDGQAPAGGMLTDESGKFFGTTAGGGSNGQGTIFELTP